ncbi:MAG: RiPP maturation radical SAM C-methyltransferase [Candidatus Omnitrophota bacterium]
MNKIEDIKNLIQSALEPGDILLIVPPFTSILSPAFGPHILQIVSQEKGVKTNILYLNILLASILGVDITEDLNVQKTLQYWSLIQERLFCRSAYGLPPLGKSPESCLDQHLAIGGEGNQLNIRDYEAYDLDLDTLYKLEETCQLFVEEVISTLASLDYKIVGATMRMGQTNCAIALINGIKRLRPDMITIVGGTNCQGEMAKGIASLSDAIDYVFSGESEVTFGHFLDGSSKGQFPPDRIIFGKPFVDFDSLPLVQYETYVTQLRYFLGDEAPKQIGLWYETSRGCWWGRKTKCSFCGINDDLLTYRQKSVSRITADLQTLGKRYPGAGVVMSDYIMPASFQEELLPLLAQGDNYPPIFFYCVKANLDLNDILRLKAAKVEKINPGIESLSTGALKLLKKGITARENLFLLRNAHSAGLAIHWFLLWGIPGDTISDYEAIIDLLPLIRHLYPPIKFFCILLERFSCYVKAPQDYGIQNFRPWAVYNMIYPEWANIDQLAYYFAGEYPSAAYDDPALIREITNEVKLWQKTWKDVSLFMMPLFDYYIIYDGRDPKSPQKHVVDKTCAREIMAYEKYNHSEYQKWAVGEKLGVIVDSWYVPLVTASPELLVQFEEREKEKCSPIRD